MKSGSASFISTKKTTRKIGWTKMKASPTYINREDYKKDRME